MTLIFLIFCTALYGEKKILEKVDVYTLAIGCSVCGVFDLYVWARWIFGL